MKSLIVNEKHYTAKELSERFGYSDGTWRKLVKNDPDVLKMQGQGIFTGKRSYTTYSVPESVAIRIYKRLKQAPMEARVEKRRPLLVVKLKNIRLAA